MRYHLPASAALKLDEKSVVAGTCYWKLTFRGDGVLGPYRLTLYSSPDMRFLSSDLFDSSIDPAREEYAEAQEKSVRVLEGEYASTGSPASSLTVVVFSDFQCAYCKRLSVLLATEPLVRSTDKVRLIFRHMPATQHDWAERAAEAAACAQVQSDAAFWSLHDALFAHQSEITAKNFDAELGTLISRIARLDLGGFQQCMDRRMSFGIVARDRRLAGALGVKGTPTLFINGKMLTGLPSANELHNSLLDALRLARIGTKGPPDR
jgi:protein-disulfide isomerase